MLPQHPTRAGGESKGTVSRHQPRCCLSEFVLTSYCFLSILVSEVVSMSRAKVMISIPEEFLAEIDKVAKEESRSRSELIREAVRLYLKMRENRKPPVQNPMVQKAIAIQDTLADQDTAVEWGSAAEIRKWRERR